MTTPTSTSLPAVSVCEPDSADELPCELALSVKLPAGQRKAIFALLYGNSPAAAARSAGVHRGTLYRWMRDDPDFRGALAECRMTLHADAREQIASLLGECAELVQGAVLGGDVQMAFRLLRAAGVLDRAAFAPRQHDQPAPQSSAGAHAAKKSAPLSARATNANVSRDAEPPQTPPAKGVLVENESSNAL